MCVYCMLGDHFFRHDPPWWKPVFPTPLQPWHPAIPDPVNPPGMPWPLDRLKELEEMLRRIKALEDQIGCPCEPNKADYLDLLKQRIAALEKIVQERKDAD